METVLITGGAGAIGSTIARLLLDKDYRVTILDDLSSGSSDLLDTRATFIKGSVCNESNINEAFSHKPRYVFHLAALFANQNSVDHPEKDLHVNGQGTLNILRASSENGVEKLLFASSSCVYAGLPIMTEDVWAAHLDTPYAMTKALGEHYCRFWSQFHRLNTVIVRLFNSYGPGEYPGQYRNVIPNFLRLAIREEPLPITGSGEEIRDFNYVGDTVQGITKAMFCATNAGDVFNIASGKGTRIIDLANSINTLTGNKAGITRIGARKWDSITKRIGVIDKAKKILGYAPETPVEDGLRKTYDWLLKVTDGIQARTDEKPGKK